jgi:two-component system chemotaxis sensor kinase CheA
LEQQTRRRGCKGSLDDLIQEFLVESSENLHRYDSELVKLEGEPDSQALLSSIFRSIHSIKGACGFLGFQKLEKLAHAGENLLSKLRDGRIRLTPEIGSALLEAGDSIRKMLASIGDSGSDGEEEFSELIARLKALQEGVLHPTERADLGSEGAVATEAGPSAPLQNPGPPAPEVNGDPALPDTPQQAAAALRPLEEGRTKAAPQDSTIRVNVNLLDKLMNPGGRTGAGPEPANAVRRRAGGYGLCGHPAAAEPGDHRAAGRGYEDRMQPISRLFDKVPRVVRDGLR